MCGIAGFWDTSKQTTAHQLGAIALQMSQAQQHRGPDSDGIWIDESAGIAFGHRRLAILDLSPSGQQPMVSANGRYVIVFNGEIYNFAELRQQLLSLGYKFRGHSDTEVMLASFNHWGVREAIARFNGMFAFALWDCQEQLLYLGRDRLGEKPLYYGWLGQTFLFASELKALRAYPHFRTEINRDALALFLRYSYIPAPYSIYKGIYKLLPGTVLTWNGQDRNAAPVLYWSAKAVAESGTATPFTGSETETISQLEVLLRDAVGLRMVADVPLGAFLSGGVDSSTTVALMQAQSSKPVKTFTIGFYEDGYNEAQYAKAVAQHLGTEHTELYVTPEEAMAVIPKLPLLYDEPFADPSQVPTFLVAQLARQQVTVSLSGDGGDELFAGYGHYFTTRKIWQQIGWLPRSLRQAFADSLSILLPAKPKLSAHKLAEVLALPNPEALYQRMVSHWKNPNAIVLGSSEPPTAMSDPLSWAKLPDFIPQMMYLDTVHYLPDDILVKLDRATMGVSLEGRIPLLDHRVVEFAWQVPLSMKVRNGTSKWLLRQVLYKYVPQELIDRPKQGFTVPLNSWLRGPLRDWAETLLDHKRLYQEGFFNCQPIQQRWAEHLSGDRNWQYYLWDVLMFQAWWDENRN